MSLTLVGAAQNDTSLNDNDEMLTVNEDSLQNEEMLSLNNDEDILSDDNTGTFTELYNKVSPGGNITLEKDYVARSGDSYIDIEKATEIDGKGHTIDAQGHTTIFKTPKYANAKLTLKNLIIKNGFSKRGWGGAIAISAKTKFSMVIINCTFINNNADFGAGAIEFTPEEGSLEIINSTFIGNLAKHGTGGAIRDGSDYTKVTDSVFENNTAQGGDGGALYFSTDTHKEDGVEIDNCIFNGNRVLRDEAGFNGGAVRAKTATLTITNSNFTNNHVTGRQEGSQKSIFGDMDGGAIESESILRLGACNFIGNSAYDCGGAVAANVLHWLSPCTFINNHVETWNDIVANKGGAVYASTFNNTAKGLIFINNSGYYGGAVYIREKDTDLVFESCYFENNRALTKSSSQGVGAAIYVDKSSSQLSLISNMFINNAATTDSAVYNCGKYGTYTGNWWGSNTPNFSHERYIVEWHRVGKNDVLTDSKYLTVVLRTDKTELFGENATLTLQFIDSQGRDFTGNLTNLNAVFSSDKGGVFSNLQVHNNKITVKFQPALQNETVTAKINNQVLTLKLNQWGDFSLLQKQINEANGVLNLTRDYTYSEVMDKDIEVILINKPLTINGNGHKIDASDKVRIFSITSDNVTINNVTFTRGFDATYGTVTIEGGSNVKILNSIFTNNYGASYGGAIFAREGGNIQISGCKFINNKNNFEGGGAIFIDTPNTKIEKSVFINNSATQGGALDLRRDNVLIDGCEFINNTATNPNKGSGGAIHSFANNLTVKNSLFLNNKALADAILTEINNNTLTLTLTGRNNYINAIYSHNNNITFSNVTYWDGAKTTSSNPICSTNESGQNITLEIYDSEGKAVGKVTLNTTKTGQAVYNYAKMEKGNYTFTATHPDDTYYTKVSYRGSFNVTKSHMYSSSINITTPNGTEFEYGKIIIEFSRPYGNDIRILVRNYNSSEVFFDYLTSNTVFDQVLPVSDEYYNITVYNLGNETHGPSQDSILFKVYKTSSVMKITTFPEDIKYGDVKSFEFEGNLDCHDYNVTIYDENNEIVYSHIEKVVRTFGSSIIPLLPAGEYNITVTNLGNNNRKENSTSKLFKILKIDNKCNVSVNDGVYGKTTTVTVHAEVDGEYTVMLNSINVTVNVVNGVGSEEIEELPAGNYTANVTFKNPNYNNNATNDTFTIQKGQSNVRIESFVAVLNQSRTIRFADFYPVKYNVTIYDENNNVITSENITSLQYNMPAIAKVGKYTLNVTNLGNDNVIGSQDSYTFNVTDCNNVEITVDNETYGRGILIMLSADVDGNYTVNITGNKLTFNLTVEVEDGFGAEYALLNLTAGKYSANVTFDNQYYKNNITNTTFTILKSESSLIMVEDAEYGREIEIVLSMDLDGTYTVNIAGYKLDIEVENGTGVDYVLLDLDAGNYSATVTFSSPIYQDVLAETTFEIFKAESNIYLYPIEDAISGEDVIVRFYDDYPTSYYIEVLDKNNTIVYNTTFKYLGGEQEMMVIFADLDAGDYIVNIESYGDKNSYGSSDSIFFHVFESDFEFDIDSEDDGNDTKITINVPEDAKGKIVVSVNGTRYPSNITNGTSVVNIPDLDDDDEIFISFISDEKYPNKTKSTTNALINSKIISQNMNRGYNSGMDFQATLVDGSNRPIANATVTVTINGKVYTVVSDANGIIRINQKLAVGTYTIVLTNPITKDKTTNTLKIVTRIIGNKNVNTYYGKNYQYKVRIIGDNGNPVGAGVSVKVTVNGKVKTLKTDKNGYIILKFTKSYLPKKYTVTVEFKGVKVSNKVVVKKVLKLKKVKVKRSAKKLKLQATLKEGKKALKNKKVTFKFNGKKYKAKTNKKGIAKVTIKKKVLKKLKPGKKVKYQVTYLKNTVKRTVKVKR
ncbi:hypothetical protein [Methanobrevibacter sp.]